MFSTENSMFNFLEKCKGSSFVRQDLWENWSCWEGLLWFAVHWWKRWTGTLYGFFVFCFLFFFNPFTPGNEPKEISYHSVIAFPYRYMTRSKKYISKMG